MRCRVDVRSRFRQNEDVNVQLESNTWISAESLRGQPSIRFVDVSVGPGARQAFEATHPVGAVRVALEQDLSAPVLDAGQGGRHPLPELAAFGAVLGRCGIDPDTPVVAYDDAGGAKAAARFWWMMRAVGHTQVAVLDGGVAEAVAAGLPLESGPSPVYRTAPYPVPEKWRLPTANKEDVSRLRADPKSVVIDVRSAERFRGESEPLDPTSPARSTFPLFATYRRAADFFPMPACASCTQARSSTCRAVAAIAQLGLLPGPREPRRLRRSHSRASLHSNFFIGPRLQQKCPPE